MEVQELLLTAAKATHIDRTFRFNPHSPQRRAICNRGDYEPAVVLETDKAAVKQVVDAGREE